MGWFYEEFGARGINFTIRVWTTTEEKIYLEAKSKVIRAIRKVCEEHGITIPSQTLTLDFARGGEGSLKKQLEGVILPDSTLENQAGGAGKTAPKNNSLKFHYLYPSGEKIR